jgi:hypothetical protein
MPIVRFVGRVLPFVVKVSFTDVPEATWEETGIGITMKFRIRVEQSIVNVECEVNEYREDYLPMFHMRAFDLARACVDVAVFNTGFGLTVAFDTFIRPDGVPTALFFTNPALPEICTASKMNPQTQEDREELGKILRIVMQEPPLFMALNDLTQAISIPHHGPTNAGRILDGLRKIVAPDLEPRNGWPIFRDIVRADEQYLALIMEHAKNTRHGDRTYIDGETTMEIVKRAWTIMNRFLEYRKSGNLPLSPEIFPTLNG